MAFDPILILDYVGIFTVRAVIIGFCCNMIHIFVLCCRYLKENGYKMIRYRFFRVFRWVSKSPSVSSVMIKRMLAIGLSKTYMPSVLVNIDSIWGVKAESNATSASIRLNWRSSLVM
ncbi:MAG: hypothetical protein ACOC1X_00185 [Promethearchaeota archaeon]